MRDKKYIGIVRYGVMRSVMEMVNTSNGRCTFGFQGHCIRIAY